MREFQIKNILQITFILTVFLSTTLQAQSLDEFRKFAVENSPALKSEFASYQAALEKIPQASALPDPTLSFGYFISPVETRVGAQHARFSLSQMFPWFGTLKAKGEVLTLMAEARFQSFIDRRNLLFLSVAQSYYGLIEINELISIEKSYLDLLNSSKSLAESKLVAGKGVRSEIIRLDLKIEDTQTSISILEDDLKNKKRRFNYLLNRDELTPVDILEATLPHLNRAVDQIIFSPDEHPRIIQTQKNVLAQEAAEKVAVKSGLPAIGLGLDYVIVGKRNDMVVSDNGKDVIMPMVTISLPIYRSKYKAAQKEARLLKESYTHKKEDITNKLLSEWQQVEFELSSSLKNLQLYEDQGARLEEALVLLQKEYQSNSQAFESLLQTQAELLMIERKRVKTHIKYAFMLEQADYLTNRYKDSE